MNKKIILFILVTICFFTSRAQTFQVGHLQQTFVDSSRSNRNITTEIYYPATVAGNNVPIALGQFPIVIFGHGFVMTWSAYSPEWNALVPNGYIMVFPTTETGIFPSHTNFGKDIAFLVGAMKAEGVNSSSAFFGAISNTSAVMGHSMGGGSAFLAVQYDTSITALASLAAANTNPSSIAAATGILIPSIVIAGANDCVAPPVQHQIPMYDSLSSACKTYISISGGSHCQFAGSNFNCSLGEATCSPQPTISSAAQQTITFDVLLPWLNYYLKNDLSAGIQFQNLITTGNGITSLQNCSLLSTQIPEVITDTDFTIYPNPSSSTSTIRTSISLTNADVSLYNLYRHELVRLNNINGSSIELSRMNIASGLYFMQITQGNNIIATYKLIVKD